MSVAGRQIWVDGELIPWERATLHVLAQSVSRGYLAFDVLSCHWLPEGPAVFGLREHCERFLRSAELAGMRLQLDLGAILAAVARTVRANRGATLIKISAYYAAVSADLLPVEPFASVAVAAFCPEEDLGAAAASTRPARLQVAKTRKLPPEVLSPQAKLAGGYTSGTIARVAARAEGFDDVLLLDREGNVAELPTQSFFWVQGGAVCSAPLDVVLAGVTRRAVLELARDEGLAVKECKLAAEQLGQADEAFVTSTSVGVRAVERISDQLLPAPVPGPITARLDQRLCRMLAGEDPTFSSRWLEPV